MLEAFAVLRPGDTGDDELAAELQQLGERQFAAHAYPRTVYFVGELPKTAAARCSDTSFGSDVAQKLAAPEQLVAVWQASARRNRQPVQRRGSDGGVPGRTPVNAASL